MRLLSEELESWEDKVGTRRGEEESPPIVGKLTGADADPVLGECKRADRAAVIGESVRTRKLAIGNKSEHIRFFSSLTEQFSKIVVHT